jgi:hypothetical protein
MMTVGPAGDYRSFTAAVSETAEGLVLHGFAAIVVLRVNGVTRLTFFVHFLKKSRFCRKIWLFHQPLAGYRPPARNDHDKGLNGT